MESARRRLFERFAALGIEARTVPYPAHRTVEGGKALRGSMAGQFTKNLLLKDKKRVPTTASMSLTRRARRRGRQLRP